MNAKETLRKLAEALNIVSEAPEQVAEAPIVEIEKEVVEEAIPVEVEATDPKEAIEENTVANASELEEVSPEAETETEVLEDPRVKELEAQLQALKDILKQTIETPTIESVAVPIDDKGLTHSVEKPISSNHKKIGNKGNDTMSRVFKYINN